jgi:hypothetical protein
LSANQRISILKSLDNSMLNRHYYVNRC